MHKNILPFHPLQSGDTLGIFTPSSPGYIWNEGLFTNGLKNLESMGFKIKLGSLTAKRASQGYRSGTPQERAQEFMELIEDPKVKGLISTIGGNNSASLIPFLDFNKIRQSQKLVCGFSDVTSLHLSILKLAGLRTVYGPSVMCWFGEWPDGVPESSRWFLDAVTLPNKDIRKIAPPKRWSNHQRNWSNDDWKNQTRIWQNNEGWRVVNPGSANGEILALNLNTLMSAAGTAYWPEFKEKILLLEDMEATLSRTERHLQQLKFIGVFDQINGLIIGKPEVYNQEGAPFAYDELFKEVLGSRPYPVISNFDCSHTIPMISITQLSQVEISAANLSDVEFSMH